MNKKIEILRAIAISAVIVIHANTGEELGVFIRPFVNFAVALFIFCSGYLTEKNQELVTILYKEDFESLGAICYMEFIAYSDKRIICRFVGEFIISPSKFSILLHFGLCSASAFNSAYRNVARFLL